MLPNIADMLYALAGQLVQAYAVYFFAIVVVFCIAFALTPRSHN
jgi:ABC-type phosphate/phosphonate transport system permease subunit